jgi:hypothetical protein
VENTCALDLPALGTFAVIAGGGGGAGGVSSGVLVGTNATLLRPWGARAGGAYLGPSVGTTGIGPKTASLADFDPYQEIDLSVLFDGDERTCVPLSTAGGIFPSQSGARRSGSELALHLPVPHALDVVSYVRLFIDHTRFRDVDSAAANPGVTESQLQ